MSFIYLWFENNIFQIRSVQEENRMPIYHKLACNYYVDAFKVKKNPTEVNYLLLGLVLS